MEREEYEINTPLYIYSKVKEFVRETPNDAELGAKVRALFSK